MVTESVHENLKNYLSYDDFLKLQNAEPGDFDLSQKLYNLISKIDTETIGVLYCPTGSPYLIRLAGFFHALCSVAEQMEFRIVLSATGTTPEFCCYTKSEMDLLFRIIAPEDEIWASYPDDKLSDEIYGSLKS